MRRVICFFDRSTREIYRKCIVFFGSTAYKALHIICTSEIVGDCWDDMSEKDYNECIERSEFVEAEDIECFEI